MTTEHSLIRDGQREALDEPATKRQDSSANEVTDRHPEPDSATQRPVGTPPRLSIETSRLRMRTVCASDAALFQALYTDVETMRFVGPPLTREASARSFRKAIELSSQNPFTHMYLTVLEKAENAGIGIGSMQKIDIQNRRAEAGLMLLREWRSRGFAQEALAGLVSTIFLELPIDCVWVQFSVDHSAARNLVRRVGFAPHDTLGKNRDEGQEIWRIERRSWQRIRSTTRTNQ